LFNDFGKSFAISPSLLAQQHDTMVCERNFNSGILFKIKTKLPLLTPLKVAVFDSYTKEGPNLGFSG
jgi:hypothetical protein